MKPIIIYATPKDEIPLIEGKEIGFFYVEDKHGNEVRGSDLNKVVRCAVHHEQISTITNVGRIG